MAPPNKSDATFLAEVKSATLVLIILHLVAFVVMVSYRAHTRQYYLTEVAIAQELADLAVKSNVVEEAGIEKNETDGSSNNPLEQYEEPMRLLSKSIFEAQDSIRINMEAMKKHAENLDRLEQQSEDLLQLANEIEADKDDSDSDAEAKPSLSHWREFMSVGSLREIPSEELEDFFINAAKEIDAIAQFEHSDPDDYDYNNKLFKRFHFDTSMGANIVKEPSKFLCPEPLEDLPVGNDDGKSNNHLQRKAKNFAHESDLKVYLEKFEEKFGNRIQAQGVHALLPESIEDIEDEMDTKLGIVFDEIFDFAQDLEDQLDDKMDSIDEDDDENVAFSSSCVDEDLVETLVTAGLNAQMAHADVREALRTSIAEISEEELILDADLDAVGGAASSHAKSRGRKVAATGTRRANPKIKSVNLRSAIDSPLLVKSVDWIDALIDTIGGYNDDLDQYLDTLTGFHGTSSVGEIVVESIMEQAGRVGDIDVEMYVDKVQHVLKAITGKR